MSHRTKFVPNVLPRAGFARIHINHVFPQIIMNTTVVSCFPGPWASHLCRFWTFNRPFHITLYPTPTLEITVRIADLALTLHWPWIVCHREWQVTLQVNLISGVPQGLVLGTLLFSINILFSWLQISITLQNSRFTFDINDDIMLQATTCWILVF